MASDEGSGRVERAFRILVHTDDDGSLWGETPDLPGVFASGQTLDELFEAMSEAIAMVLIDDPSEINVERSGGGFVVDSSSEPVGQDAPKALGIVDVAPAPVVPIEVRRMARQHAEKRFSVREMDLLIEA